MNKRLIFLVLLSVFIGIFSFGITSALIPINNCQDLGIAGETYQLTGDIIDNSLTGPCLRIIADNVEVDCQNFKIESNDAQTGIYSNSDNTVIRNCVIDMFSSLTNEKGTGIELIGSMNSRILDSIVRTNYYGVFIDSASTGTIINNLNANDNYYGIYTQSGIILTNSIFTNNKKWDVYLSSVISVAECSSTSFTNVIGTGGFPIEFYSGGVVPQQDFSELILCDYSGNDETIQNINVGSGSNNIKNNGILIIRGNDFNFLNVNSNNNQIGVELHESIDVDFSTLYADDNEEYGFDMKSSSGIDISNSFLRENYYYDFYMGTGSDSHCINSISNTIGSGGRPIEYYGAGTTNINDRLVSEMILCNADGVSLNNVNVSGSDTNYNNGFLLFRNDNGNLNNIDSSGNYIGIYSGRSNTNTITNSDTHYNKYGVWLSAFSTGNTLDNVFAHNNTWDGIRLYTADGSIITNSGGHENQYGLHIDSTESVFVSDSTFQENRLFDSWVEPTIDAECTHTYTNVVGSGGRPIEFYGAGTESVNNRVTSMTILCNTDGVSLNNIDVFGSDSINNNALEVARTSEAQINNLNSTGNRYGVYNGYTSNGNNYFDAKLNDNALYGAYLLTESDGNRFTFSSFNGNAYDDSCGIYFSDSDNNIVEDSSIIGNVCGIDISGGSQNNSINNNSIFNNEDGVIVSSSLDNQIVNNSILSNINDGIFIYNVAAFEINNNTICYNGNMDVECTVESDSTFQSNTCDNVDISCGTCALPCSPPCVDDSECQNGIYCDGEEQCVFGACQTGNAINCDDGVSCTIDSCNEGIQACDYLYDGSGCVSSGFCEDTPVGYGPWEYSGTGINGCSNGQSCAVQFCDDYNKLAVDHQGYPTPPINPIACETDCAGAALNEQAYWGTSEGSCAWNSVDQYCYFTYGDCKIISEYEECIAGEITREAIYWAVNVSGEIDPITCPAPCENPDVNGKCHTEVPCAKIILLPLFTFREAILSTILIGLLYYFIFIRKP